MYRTANSHRVLGLAVTTAMAGVLLSGCATTAAPHGLAASRSARVSARAKGQDPGAAHRVGGVEEDVDEDLLQLVELAEEPRISRITS